MKAAPSFINPAEISTLDELVKTVLYEGYSLFPYHRSAVKNQTPVPLGVIYPEAYGAYNSCASTEIQGQCILCSEIEDMISVKFRFLHLLEVEGNGWQTVERRIDLSDLKIEDLIENRLLVPFQFSETERGANILSSVLPIRGEMVIHAEKTPNKGICRVTVRAINTSLIEDVKTASRERAMQQSFLSTNMILISSNGHIISAQDPPDELKAIVESCKNICTWQIMVDEADRAVLFSPIILYDYPKIHPQSKIELFDCTEIEEALMLHVAVMSEDEKQRIAASDPKLRAMLSKIDEMVPQELIGLHGGMKETKK